jgi:hypothetical protein
MLFMMLNVTMSGMLHDFDYPGIISLSIKRALQPKATKSPPVARYARPFFASIVTQARKSTINSNLVGEGRKIH